MVSVLDRWARCLGWCRVPATAGGALLVSVRQESRRQRDFDEEHVQVIPPGQLATGWKCSVELLSGVIAVFPFFQVVTVGAWNDVHEEDEGSRRVGCIAVTLPSVKGQLISLRSASAV